VTRAGRGVLVVGYGNVLRTHDGVGWHVAARLADDPRLRDATILRWHQLTPELSLDVSRVRLVVFVDAAHGPAAGSFTVRPVDDAAGAGAGAGSGSAFSHQLDPLTLLGLARTLYGHAPAAVVVSVGVASLEVGEGLSPVVEAAVPAIADAVAALVASRAGRGTGPVPELAEA
jgi:hydrogenase maturation protease